MKKILYLLLCAVILSACSDDEALFDKEPDARLQEQIAKHAAMLLQPESGWKAVYYPNEKNYGGYSFLMNFSENGNVNMLADFDDGERLSTYSIKALEQPTLIFDTYGLLSKLADPDGEVNSGINGTGLDGEQEFHFYSVTESEVILKEKVSGGKMVLTKATGTDWNEFDAIQENVKKLEDAEGSYFRSISFSDGKKVAFIYSRRKVVVKYIENKEVVVKTGLINYTTTGFSFREPMLVFDKEIVDFTYDEADGKFKLESQNAAIEEEVEPLFEEKGAVKRYFRDLASMAKITYYSKPINHIEAEIREEFPDLEFMFLLVQEETYGILGAWKSEPIKGDQFAGAIYITSPQEREDVMLHLDFSWIATFGAWAPELMENKGYKELQAKLLVGDYFYANEGDGVFAIVSKEDPSIYIRVQAS